MNAYRVLPEPTEQDKWLLKEEALLDENISFLGELKEMWAKSLPAGPTRLIAYNIDKRVYVENMATITCLCGTLFVTQEEMEKHL